MLYAKLVRRTEKVYPVSLGIKMSQPALEAWKSPSYMRLAPEFLDSHDLLSKNSYTFYYIKLTSIIDLLCYSHSLLYIVNKTGSITTPFRNYPSVEMDVLRVEKVLDLSKVSTWKWMRRHGVDISASAALEWAAAHGYLDVVEYLHLYAKEEDLGESTAFTAACDKARIDVVAFFVKTDRCCFEAMDVGFLTEALLKERTRLLDQVAELTEERDLIMNERDCLLDENERLLYERDRLLRQ